MYIYTNTRTHAHSHTHTHTHLRITYAVLGTYFSFLDCLSKTVSQQLMILVSDSEESVVDLHLSIKPVTTCSGMEPVICYQLTCVRVCFVQSLHHMYRAYGGWTFALEPFFKLNFTAELDTPQAAVLQTIIDPVSK